MLDTSSRLLALLSLLQSRPRWTGPELAEHLDGGVRTVRNDVTRLRELGYTVDAAPGRTGHYALGIGAVTPPLLLDDDEAVAVTLGLRAGIGLAGLPDQGARALAKLERVLPHRLRRTVAALHDATGFAPANTTSDVEDPHVDPELLARLAAAIATAGRCGSTTGCTRTALVQPRCTRAALVQPSRASAARPDPPSPTGS